LQDIINLFVNNSIFLNPRSKMASLWLINCYKPFNFTNIVRQTHALPKSLENFPLFHGHNSISAHDHWDAFMDFIMIA
jgi:predicted transcriptional regulator